MKSRVSNAVAFLFLLLLSVIAVQLSVAKPQHGYVVIDLGTMGGPSSLAHGINNRTQIVGYAQTTGIDPNFGSPISRPFLWQNGVMMDLGTLGGLNGQAWAINNRGQVVAGADINEVVDPVITSYTFHGFVWDKGIKTDIGTLVPDGRFSEVFTINSKGQASGYAATSDAYPDGFPFFHAILWENGVMQDLGTLGGDNSLATSMNNRGQVVGWADDLIVGFRAFLWEKGAMIDLGTLGGPNAVASAIDEQGRVVGGAHINFEVDPMFGEPISHAFLWDKGMLTDLGTLGGKLSFALEINNRGQIIGFAQTTEILPDGFQVFHPFLWEGSVASDLNDLIPPDSGWELLTAEGINEIGEIVGGGIINGEFHAFLLTPGHGNSDNFATRSILKRDNRRAGNRSSLHIKYRGLIEMGKRRMAKYQAFTSIP